jgi:hypothetical protein
LIDYLRIKLELPAIFFVDFPWIKEFDLSNKPPVILLWITGETGEFEDTYIT